jgi:ubiquinone/menaquinone biosynthesis C-methylase UbiE
MIAHEELTDTSYDDIRFEQIFIEEIGPVLPEPLVVAYDLSHARAVLEIGCGSGAWLRRVAQQYPDLQCIGIDQDARLVKVASALAQRDQLAQVAFLAQPLGDLFPTLFPEGSFDLIHLSFLSRYILTANYPALAQVATTFCRPGGIVCWIEAELPVTNSPACEQLVSLVCTALQRAGQSFIPESMWEWAAYFAPHSGSSGLDRSTFQRRHLGITPMLGGWLRNAGCGAPPERPRYGLWQTITHVIHEEASVIDVSAGQPAHAVFPQQVMRFAQQVQSLLLRTGVIEEREFVVLCSQLEMELALPAFCGLFFLLRAWAPRI